MALDENAFDYSDLLNDDKQEPDTTEPSARLRALADFARQFRNQLQLGMVGGAAQAQRRSGPAPAPLRSPDFIPSGALRGGESTGPSDIEQLEAAAKRAAQGKSEFAVAKGTFAPSDYSVTRGAFMPTGSTQQIEAMYLNQMLEDRQNRQAYGML